MPAPTPNNFASLIEARAGEPQDYICFLDTETGEACTYFELRLRGVWLAREMEAQGVLRGGACAVSMGNVPALFYTLVAAAYGGFSLVLLNDKISEEEQKRRIAAVARMGAGHDIPLLDETTASALIREADESGPNARNLLAQWARRGVGSFDEENVACYMLKATSAGRQRVVPLTWTQLLGAARACNTALSRPNEGIWQLVLPAYHVDGVQVFFRSVLNHNAMLLYRSFDAARVLADAQTYHATHIALGSKMLQDLLDANEVAPLDADDTSTIDGTGKAGTQSEKAPITVLESYECIMVDAAEPNKQTLTRALGQHVPVFVVYGRTETASYVAAGRLASVEHLEMQLFEGYTATIAAPNAEGIGQLGIAGPGVIAEYLNARAAFTADGFFLTGDEARLANGVLELEQSSSETILSGGENIFPAEIRDKILSFEGVSDAYVFGASDVTWGQRPVAFVEAGEASSRPGFNRFYAADDMRNRLSTRLDSVNMPDQFVFMDEFPRTSVGKVGTGTLGRLWDMRIQVAQVEIWHVRLPLVSPIRTASMRLRYRDVGIVRVQDFAGRTGIGECDAFDTGYTLETLSADLALLREELAPLLVGRVLLHPGEAPELFENVAGAAGASFACAALETALWDLYGKIRNRSIRQLIGARASAKKTGALDEIPAGHVRGGVVISLGGVPEVLAAVKEAVDAGYTRVKLKVKPGSDIDTVRAVRNAYPNLPLAIDADQSYHDDQIDLLLQLEEFGLEYIEEPLNPAFTPTVGPKNLFDRLARLQTQLRTRVCLDESWQTEEQLREVLESHPELRCVSLKVGKFGGVARAVAFHAWARDRGIEAWPGGMYDTGVSKRLHAAFGLLPGVNLAGDISDSSRYFTADICNPPFVLQEGMLLINNSSYPAGLGCELNESILPNVTESYWIV